MKKALVLSLVVVLGLGVASFAQTLTGSWNTLVSIVPSPVSMTLTSELIVNYIVGAWTFNSDTKLTNTGWSAQSFQTKGTLGAFTVDSTLTFDPAAVAFKEWKVVGGLSLAGVGITGTFDLEPGVTTLSIVGSGSAGLVDPVKITLNLGSGKGCDFDFNGVTFEATFPFCCGKVLAKVAFSCDGFLYADFSTKGILIPNLPWLGIDAAVHFTMQTKTLTLTPKFNWGTFACVDFGLFIDQTYTGGVGPDSILSLSNFNISGIQITCKIGTITFLGISDWGTVRHGILYGTPYWEAYRISTSADGCCGGTFVFDLTAYFKKNGTQLFDVSEIVANMSVNVTKQFQFISGVTVDLDPLVPGTAFTLWTVGFNVTWGL